MRRVFWSVLVFAVACGAFCGVSASALAGSEGRVFELVSPIYKGGFGATFIEAVGQNGESAAFYAPTAFSGAPAGLSQNIDGLDYVSRRGPSGWSTVPVMPPDTLLPAVAGGGGGSGNRDVSPEMAVTLALGQLGSSNEAAEKNGTEDEFFLHDTELPDTNANWNLAGFPLTLVDHTAPIFFRYLGGSPDFCHLLFDEGILNEIRSGPKVPLEQAENANEQLYELTRGCDGGPAQLKLVAVTDNGDLISPLCRADLGIEHFAGIHKEVRSAFNAVAADGGMSFFTTCIDNEESDHQLFVRLDGSRTQEVSKPLSEECAEGEIPCKGAKERPSASFAGASEDGSKVFFTTSARLNGEDVDNGNDLYMAEIGCSSGVGCGLTESHVTELVQVSHDPNAGEADVQGVVRVSPDGSRVYFVAEGALLNGAARLALEGEGRPLPEVGADNLYVYDRKSGRLEFVGDVCSGHDSSGSVEDRHCPNQGGTDVELWLLQNGDSSLSQTAGADGRYIVFSSYGQLTSDDTDTARDVYRFDSLTGRLERVSIGEAGADQNGNDSEFDTAITTGHFGGSVLRQYEMNNRAVSDDGSRIVFTTAEPLAPAATNNLVNVYEWHENVGGGGNVSLLSDGSGPTSVEDVVIAPGGTDVFFVTSQGLTPQDVDGEPDVYDARLGGGFAPVPAFEEPCSGDTCQGPLTNPAPLLVPSSVSQTPGENFAPPRKSRIHPKAKKHKKRKSRKKPKRKAKRARHAGGSSQLARRNK